MMRLPSRMAVEKMATEYPPGTRVELLYMEDQQAPPRGTKGTVLMVDDIGTIHVRWDNGSGLGVAYGQDSIRRVQK